MTTTRPSRPTNAIRRCRMTRITTRWRLATNKLRKTGNAQHFVVSYGRTRRLPSNECSGATCNLRLRRPQECEASPGKRYLSLTRRTSIGGLTGYPRILTPASHSLDPHRFPSETTQALPAILLLHPFLRAHLKYTRPVSIDNNHPQGNDSLSPDRQHQSQEHDDSESEDTLLLDGPPMVHNSFPGTRGCPNGNQQQALQR